MAAIELLLIITLTLGGLWLAWRWSSRPPVSGPSCSRCAHDVRQVTASRCPECGADLGTAGILTPEMGRTAIAPRRLAVLGLTIVAFAAGLGAATWSILGSFGPGARQRHEFLLSVNQPTSGAFASFEIQGHDTTRDGRIRFGPHCLRVVWSDGSRSAALCIEPAARPVPAGGRQSGSPVIAPEDLPVERVFAWGRSIGLDPADPAIRVELIDMHRIATRSIRDDHVRMGVPTQGLQGMITGFSTVGRAPDPGATWIAIGVGMTVVALGLASAGRTSRIDRIVRQKAWRERAA